ncbi:MAG: class I adenylate-forming enzyme family protein [Pseudomonadota bacterium]
MPHSGPALSGPAPLNNLLSRSVSQKPDELAMISDTGRWTWRQLDQETTRVATYLAATGLKPGDRVASLMPNCGELLIYFLACLKGGLVSVPLNYRYTPPEIDYAMEKAGAALLLVHGERAADVAASAMAGSLENGIISFDGQLPGSIRLESVLQSETDGMSFQKVDENAPAFLFHTSGSTGKPKAVMHSHLSFGAITASFAKAMLLRVDDVVFPGGSISHVGSLSTALAAFSVGSRVVLSSGFDATMILPLLREQRPTVMVMLPSALIALQHDHNASGEDFSSLRLCITGGDKFPLDQEREFAELTGLAIRETYGLTEATDCLVDPPDQPVRPGSVGVLSPGYRACLVDDKGKEVPVGTDGNLLLSGDPVSPGYWQDPDANAAAFVDGWFKTGDVMQVDGDGYFWFRGRKKQIIVHDGSNIAPQEIEEAVMAHSAIQLAGVVGVHDAVHGENVWAYVSLRDGAKRPTAQDIIDCARKTVGYKAPEVIIFVDEMPINATGKVDRLALKQLAAKRVTADHGT